MSKTSETAYRRRAWLIGILQSCYCEWPETIAATSTGHDETCTAHVWLTNRAAIAKLDPRQCCVRDEDMDGKCDVHSAQGVLRKAQR